MIPGVKIQLGNKEFEIPPLSLGMLRNGLMEKMKKHDELLQKPNMDANDLLLIRGEIIFAALKRNYSRDERNRGFRSSGLWKCLPCLGRDFGAERLCGGSSTGQHKQTQLQCRPYYAAFAAAYGWSRTISETNTLFPRRTNCSGSEETIRRFIFW